jgi:hypothetical protein
MAEVYSKNPDMIFRKVADELLIVPIRRNVGDLESIYALTPVAARIWELINGSRSAAQIAESLAVEFDVSADEAGKDLREFLNTLKDEKMIEEV